MEKLLISIGILALLSACATVPESLQGDFAKLAMAQAKTPDAAGKRVRWGGEIVEVTPKPDETCFELVDYPLDAVARPVEGDNSGGRFIACTPGFYDPVIYSQGRELTVTGTLANPVAGNIGNYSYQYPQVTAATLYLWPRRTAGYGSGYGSGIYDPFFYSPFYGRRDGFLSFGGFGRFH